MFLVRCVDGQEEIAGAHQRERLPGDLYWWRRRLHPAV